MVNNTGTIMLSILIPSIPERRDKFHLLVSKLDNQIDACEEIHPTLGKCEILFDRGKSFRNGGKSIGKKRESLIGFAEGKYLCFLDDDEDISPDYVETLMRLCNEDKDVCCFRSLATLANNWALIDLSLDNKENEQINPESITYRKPWHICPIKTEHAKLYEFENINYGEDWNWFEKILTHCNTQAKTNKIIHNYNHGAHSEADKIK